MATDRIPRTLGPSPTSGQDAGALEALEANRLLQRWQSAVAELSLAQYKELLAGVPPPSPAQRERFALHVSHAHSWYKHLPGLPVVPFYFYLDPNAGSELIAQEDGRVLVLPRTEQGFHHTWIPTAPYREKFGPLGFASGSGTMAMAGSAQGTILPPDAAARVISQDGKPCSLPVEILSAGEVKLSALMHEGSLARLFWLDGVIRLIQGSFRVNWPEESGGRDALNAIIARYRGLHDGSIRREDFSEEELEALRMPGRSLPRPMDAVLYRLCAPEHQRQRREIVKAIDRVCDLVFA